MESYYLGGQPSKSTSAKIKLKKCWAPRWLRQASRYHLFIECLSTLSHLLVNKIIFRQASLPDNCVLFFTVKNAHSVASFLPWTSQTLCKLLRWSPWREKSCCASFLSPWLNLNLQIFLREQFNKACILFFVNYNRTLFSILPLDFIRHAVF